MLEWGLEPEQLPSHGCDELLYAGNQQLLVLELVDGGDVLQRIGDVECAGNLGHLRGGHLVRDLKLVQRDLDNLERGVGVVENLMTKLVRVEDNEENKVLEQLYCLL